MLCLFYHTPAGRNSQVVQITFLNYSIKGTIITLWKPYSGWKKFPSCLNNIPKLFNQGHNHHHIVESVQFVNAEEINNESDEDVEDLHTAKPLIRGKKILEKWSCFEDTRLL